MPIRPKQADGADRKGSIAATVRAYIDARPIVREALGLGIVNLSALSRQIMEETGLTQEEGVLVACRRYTFRAVPKGFEGDIRRLLGKSKLEVRTRVGILTVAPHKRLLVRMEKVIEALHDRNIQVHVIHGSEAVTIITDENVLDDVEAILAPDEPSRRRTGLVELNLRSPEIIEDVPGILSYITSSLSARGINFVDVISCHKDNMFIIDEDQLFAAFEVLNRLGA